MKKSTPDTVFEKRYQKYYVDFILKIHLDNKGQTVHPSLSKQEEIIEECKHIDCDFRFIDDTTKDVIKPLFKDDKFYPFPSEITNEDFFRLIHPAYLIPYFIYAAFGYELAKEINASWEQLIQMNYQICLPIKLPNAKEYYWFTQTARILTLTDKNQVISHVNFYKLFRKFKEFNEKAENIFIEATILSNHEVYQDFQKFLEGKMTEYYKHGVFKKQHWDILRARSENSNTQYSKSSVFELNKEISNLMQAHTGYRFSNIDEIITYLQDIKVL